MKVLLNSNAILRALRAGPASNKRGETGVAALLRPAGSVDVTKISVSGATGQFSVRATSTSVKSSDMRGRFNEKSSTTYSKTAQGQIAALFKPKASLTSAKTIAASLGSKVPWRGASSAGPFVPPPPAVAGISIVFNNNEGSLPTSPRTDRSPMAYEHAIPTKDGTLIEAFDGAHEQWGALPAPIGGVIRNRVGEFVPSTDGSPTGTIVEVFPWNATPTSPYGSFGATGYDNVPYCYDESTDSLIVFGGGDTAGQYKRDAVDNGAGSRWIRHKNPNFPPVGRPPLWSSNANANALFYVPAAELAVWEERCGYYNTPVIFNSQTGVGVMIGGSKQPGPSPMDYGSAFISFFIPANLIPGLSTNARYYIHTVGLGKALSGGVPFLLANNRGGIACIGSYVYWGGGVNDIPQAGNPNLGTFVPSMFRMDLASIINRTDPRVNAATVTAMVERLADCPVAHHPSSFTADPYTNVIKMFDINGVFLYDVTNNTWSNVTSQLTGYVSDFANAGFGSSYISWPHAGYIDTRNGTVLRKSYWFGGSNGNTAPANLFSKARSIKTARATQNWATRSAASGVLWAHDFSSSAEVEQFTFVGGMTGSNPDPATIPNVIARVAGVGPNGASALRTKLIGNTLTQATPSGVAGNSHVFNVSQASDFPDPAVYGPYTVFVGDPSDDSVQPYEAVTVTARNVGANTLTVTRRNNTIDYPRPVLGVTYAYPNAASFPAGWTIGMNQGGEWRRPLVPLAAGSNGRATADPGVSNGAKRAGAAYSWVTTRDNQNHYFFRRGYFGSRYYWDSATNSSAKWANQFVASDFTSNAAQGNIFEGDEFYLQWRMRVSTNMMTEHPSKFFYLHNTATGGHAQIWGHVGRKKTAEVPLASEVINGVTYGNVITLFTQGGDGRAVDNKGYMLADRLDSGFGGSGRMQNDYPATGTSPSLGSFCWPGDTWVTFMLHVRFGRDNAENLPVDTSSFNIHAPYPADTDPTYRTTVEFFAHLPGWSDYKKLIGNYNYPWWFGDGISDTNFFPYNPAGLNAIWLSPFSNLYQNSGGEPPHRSTIIVDYAQAILSKKPIAPPSD